jgi:hypothetical protein
MNPSKCILLTERSSAKLANARSSEQDELSIILLITPRILETPTGRKHSSLKRHIPSYLLYINADLS